jgi:hypothetical protein
MTMVEEISDEVSKKLAKELTEKYPATVYGMAKGVSTSSSSKLTSLRVKKVTNNGCDIALVTCRGDLCEMNNEYFEFKPPLKSASELMDIRIHEIRDQVLAPKVHWLVTDPLAFFILATCTALGYGTIVVGMGGIIEGLAKAPKLENGIAVIFGSTSMFSFAVVGAFWFAIVAHVIEAGMALRHCVKSLQLGMLPSALWAILVFLVGYPIFSRFRALVVVQEQYYSKSK